MIHINLNDKNVIKEIENLFSIEYMAQSRIDGSPMFFVDKNKIEELKEFFTFDIVRFLEDNITGFMGIPYTPNPYPGGKKDNILLKISECKQNYVKALRGKKLKKIEIYF